VYVVGIDPEKNQVTVGEKQALMRTRLTARQVNWIGDRVSRAGGAMRCSAKIRYNHLPQPAVVRITGEDEFEVTFDEPVSAITPGQAVVLYDGDVVLGGGWIERAL
jgi:tRNA-specific 2-thiouridylase